MSRQFDAGPAMPSPDAPAAVVQRAATASTAAHDLDAQVNVRPFVAALEQARSQGGRPLPMQTRVAMESRFATDLSRVRVHDGARAAGLSEALSARAFTVGEHVFFNQGQHRPDVPGGARLMAHELTHVIQHRGRSERLIHRSPSNGESQEVMPARRDYTGPENALPGGVEFLGILPDLGRQRAIIDLADAERRIAADGVATTAAAVGAPVNLTVLARAGRAEAGLQLRCSERVGGAVKSSHEAALTEDALLPDFRLANMSGSEAVGRREHELVLEARTGPEQPWMHLGQSRLRVYRTAAAPESTWPLSVPLLEKACRYASGLRGKDEVARALRAGPRSVDGLAYSPTSTPLANPFEIYAAKSGQCRDFAQLLAVLAKTLGLMTELTLVWGGLERGAERIAVTFDSAVTMVNVKPGRRAFGPGEEHLTEFARYKAGGMTAKELSPHGWAFGHHVVANIEGKLQDAALDREGVDGQAFHEGLPIRFIDPKSKVVALKGRVNRPLNHFLERRTERVKLVFENHSSKTGVLPSAASFGRALTVLDIPPGVSHSTPLEFDVSPTVVAGEQERAALGGLRVVSRGGAPHLVGTPASAGVHAFELRFDYDPLRGTPFMVRLDVARR